MELLLLYSSFLLLLLLSSQGLASATLRQGTNRSLRLCLILLLPLCLLLMHRRFLAGSGGLHYQQPEEPALKVRRIDITILML
jgi:hypothetical protein